MAITEDDVAEDLHRAVEGAAHHRHAFLDAARRTAISTPALERARRNDVRTVLDIDYRPVLWGLTKRGDGETRFIASPTRSPRTCSGILPLFDLVIGTERGVRDRRRRHRHHRGAAARCARVTHGDARRQARADGLRGDRRPDSRDRWTTRSTASGVTVEVLNVLGAGDAFSAGLPVRLGARRGLRRVRALRERLRRARRVAPRLRAGDADARRARLLSRQRASAFRGRTATRR